MSSVKSDYESNYKRSFFLKLSAGDQCVRLLWTFYHIFTDKIKNVVRQRGNDVAGLYGLISKDQYQAYL